MCLWRLYFGSAATMAGQALARLDQASRAGVAGNAYSRAHFPLIAGIIYIALGIEQVLDHLAHRGPHHPGGAPLGWTSTTALFGGAVLYLAGRILFLRLTIRTLRPGKFVAVGVVLLLLPVAHLLPALAALGLLAAFLAGLLWYERRLRPPQPTDPS